ncbi:MAG: glucose-1-phosphate adenylyltransferase subunit GlgD [Clostridia bacterium]|nr:glucose-1-phosphate adenylyltransferase subunit GlgD [Clostridia bacterium]
MRHNTVMGLLFSDMHNEAVPELTGIRAIGSVPFGGRYRLIDFPLSNLVNAGVSKVGVVTKSNYQSLMDHLGSGKAWGLSRKSEGLYFLPPTGGGDEHYEGRITPLSGIMPFLRRSKEDYVILSDCHVVGNINYRKLLEYHIEKEADITMAYVKGVIPKNLQSPMMSIAYDGRVNDLYISDRSEHEIENYGIGLYVIGRELLIRFVETAMSRNQLSFEWDVLHRHIHDRRIFAYPVPEYLQVISSLESYFEANRALLDSAVREQLFKPKRKIYTKIRDTEPALYGLHSKVSNSLIADGCNIEGTVSNSIVFRNVRVARNAVIKNSIVMQGSVICGGTDLDYVVLDKNVCVRDGRSLKGCADYPISVKKNTMV